MSTHPEALSLTKTTAVAANLSARGWRVGFITDDAVSAEHPSGLTLTMTRTADVVYLGRLGWRAAPPWLMIARTEATIRDANAGLLGRHSRTGPGQVELVSTTDREVEWAQAATIPADWADWAGWSGLRGCWGCRRAGLGGVAVTTQPPRPYASHTEAGQRHEDRLPDLCRRGLHDLSDPANVRRKSSGVRQCRACQKEAQRRWARANRERYNANKRAEYERNRERRLAVQRTRYADLHRCRRGHVQDTTTEYTRPDGRRECRRCRRRYQAAWRARQKEN